MTATATHTTSTDKGALRRTRAFGVAGAVVAALAVWTIAVPLLGVDLQVTPGTDEPQVVGPGTIAVVSLVAALAGWGSLALLERLTARGPAIWTATALLVLVLSLGGPMAGVTTAATVTLAAMHIAVAAVLVPLLARRGGFTTAAR